MIKKLVMPSTKQITIGVIMLVVVLSGVLIFSGSDLLTVIQKTKTQVAAPATPTVTVVEPNGPSPIPLAGGDSSFIRWNCTGQYQGLMFYIRLNEYNADGSLGTNSSLVATNLPSSCSSSFVQTYNWQIGPVVSTSYYKVEVCGQFTGGDVCDESDQIFPIYVPSIKVTNPNATTGVIPYNSGTNVTWDAIGIRTQYALSVKPEGELPKFIYKTADFLEKNHSWTPSQTLSPSQLLKADGVTPKRFQMYVSGYSGTGLIYSNLSSFFTISNPPSYQGFGATTPGGAGKPVYHVTNLSNSGVGSLRDGLVGGNRSIVFDVSGEINISSYLDVGGPFVTIDGLSAPTPGVTVKGGGFRIRGDLGAHDVIVRGIRIRNSFEDGVQIGAGTYNVVIDHVSVQNSTDGNIDITQAGTHDVTVSWSILAKPAVGDKNMLISFTSSRITLHHNIFIESNQRNPLIKYDDVSFTQDPNTTTDMRNNLIWDWAGGVGTRIMYGSRANVVNNYYGANGGDAPDALIVCKIGGFRFDSGHCGNSDTRTVARAFTSGNYSPENVALDTRGTETSGFSAPSVTTSTAAIAACDAYRKAGVRPLDSVDALYISHISLPGCI